MGLHWAFPEAEIVGVDIKPQPRYSFTFVQADALTFPLDGYDFFWASPMCQDHTRCQRILDGKGLAGRGGGHQIAAIRERLRGLPYVIENVPGAPLLDAVRLCGTMFGLRVYRHRYFESSFSLQVPNHPKHVGGTKSHRGYSKDMPFICVGGHNYNVSQGKAAMGIDWMKRDELNEAVPPAYSQYIASQLRSML